MNINCSQFLLILKKTAITEIMQLRYYAIMVLHNYKNMAADFLFLGRKITKIKGSR